ncbi:hypothetical protein [Deinococcus hohokamensis]|uniref:Uncharacterized protein n=1 Tax=Deinococcus hohokamensis TaxID=309883 RepID=A0ABV9I870_9DEIO
MTREDHDRRNAEQVQLLLSELRARTRMARTDEKRWTMPANRACTEFLKGERNGVSQVDPGRFVRPASDTHSNAEC